MIYPEADLVLGKAVRCASCNKPTTVTQYHRESGTIRISCKCGGSPFQNIIPATAGVGA